MNLGWLAATLSPRDVALHPDFDDRNNPSAPGYLAVVVLGEDWRFRYMHPEDSLEVTDSPDPAIRYVEHTLSGETLAQGLRELSGELLHKKPTDTARDCSLALLACCAAAELDDYDTCLALLEAQLRWTARAKDPDGRLIQAVLQQQKGLRLRDSGRPYQQASATSLQLLDNLNVGTCTPFKLSSSVARSYTNTLAEIVTATRDAAYSLLSSPESEAAWSKLVPSHRERLRAQDVEYLLNVDRRTATIYSDFVAQLFERRFQGTQTWIIGGPRVPDLFYSTLALELLGHGAVYQARRELARLRFVESPLTGDYSQLGDGLRLLRQAAAKKDLEVALRLLRASGPLGGLSEDSRRVLQFRLQPERLRSVELRVLEGAAELLTQSEAGMGLQAIVASLAAGAPPNLPGEWELDILRIEIAWRAAASLANTAGQQNSIAELLYSEMVSVDGEDHLRDSAIARAVRNLEWDSVDQGIKARWRDWLIHNGEKMPATMSVAASIMTGVVTPTRDGSLDFDNLATQLNAAMRGERVDPDIIETAIPLVREALVDTRESAARGVYSFGGIVVADIAAGLILYANVVELWVDLADFLNDTVVPRMHRSAAFERLANEAPELPPEARERFVDRASDVLDTPDHALESSSITPYPEALRFFGRLGIISDVRTLDLTARLTGMSRYGRQEAARTIATLSRSMSSPWLLALAFELSHDEDSEARAYAGRCLAQLAGSSPTLADSSRGRLLELLNEDGLLIPLFVLRGLQALGSSMPTEIRTHIQGMSENHPSRMVRLQATKLLGRSPQTGT